QPGLDSVEGMLELQRTIGNQAVGRLLAKERQDISGGTRAARQMAPALPPGLLNMAGPALSLDGQSLARAAMHTRQGGWLRLDTPGSRLEHNADAIADRALGGVAPARRAAPIATTGPAPAPGPAVAAALAGGVGAPLPSTD